jgi:hypothetical protein
MPGAQCTRSRAQKSAHGWPRVTGDSPAFPHANGFNGFLRALLGDEFLFVTVASRIGGAAEPVGPTSPPQGLTSATDARTTRLHRTQLSRPDAPASHVLPAEVLAKTFKHRSSCTPSIAHGDQPALRPPARTMLPRPPHPIPTFSDDGRRPSSGMRRRGL